MTESIQPHNPEKKESMEDNARKFISAPIEQSFLEANHASSFVLASDWLITDEESEKKLAHKTYPNGDVQILLISKVTKDGNRVSEKTKISEGEYAELLASSVLRLEKTRYEFSLVQNEKPFVMKYDEFVDSDLRILEVDAASEEERGSFDPSEFPYDLSEVTGDQAYYGYRVSDRI